MESALRLLILICASFILPEENHSHLRLITNRREDLEVLPPETRVSFVLSPEPSEVRRTFSFLRKIY